MLFSLCVCVSHSLDILPSRTLASTSCHFLFALSFPVSSVLIHSSFAFFFFFSFPQCVVPSILWSPCVLHAIDDLNLVRVFCAHGIAFCLDGGCCLPMNNDTHTQKCWIFSLLLPFAPFFLSLSSSVHHFYCGKYVKFRHRFSSFSHAHWKLVFTANECVQLARTHILFSHPLCVC